jgi:hypothetical protein
VGGDTIVLPAGYSWMSPDLRDLEVVSAAAYPPIVAASLREALFQFLGIDPAAHKVTSVVLQELFWQPNPRRPFLTPLNGMWSYFIDIDPICLLCPPTTLLTMMWPLSLAHNNGVVLPLDLIDIVATYVSAPVFKGCSRGYEAGGFKFTFDGVVNFKVTELCALPSRAVNKFGLMPPCGSAPRCQICNRNWTAWSSKEMLSDPFLRPTPFLSHW